MDMDASEVSIEVKSTEPTERKGECTSEELNVLNEAVDTLYERRDQWVTLPLGDKIALLQQVHHLILEGAQAQVDDAMKAKGLPLDSPLASEDWLSGPYANGRVVGTLITALQSLLSDDHTGVTHRDARLLPNGQVAVTVFPKSLTDRILLFGFHGEVRLLPGVGLDDWEERTARVYRHPPERGKVALVLGAGNVASIGLLDMIHKLYLEAQVCILKFNPVNEYLEPHYRKILAPLIDEGYVRLTRGGAKVGEFLCQHPQIEEIHITGSSHTHDLIVYGAGEDGALRKAKDEPICDKRITSELGNVSPVIIVPGSWTERELRFHAANIATMMYNNSGFNCNAARVIITQRDWPQRRALLDAIRDHLSRLDARPAYYPGAKDRLARFVDSHDGAEMIRTHGIDKVEGAIPVGLIVEVDSANEEHLCFQEEAFCALAATTSLDASDVPSFLREATRFANDVVWGTLNATILIDPRTAQTHMQALEKSIDELHYGSVCVNHWPALSYGLGGTTWGAYPGHTPQDIRSGIGVVHNTFLIEDVEKTVIRGPFVVWPKPPWFMSHKRSTKLAKVLLETTRGLTPVNVAKLAYHALQG